jgi:hypothetical protein
MNLLSLKQMVDELVLNKYGSFPVFVREEGKPLAQTFDFLTVRDNINTDRGTMHAILFERKNGKV